MKELVDDRQELLGLKPDIDRAVRKQLAKRVLIGEPLQDYERKFVARLVDPEPAKKTIGRPPTTRAAVKRVVVAEHYYERRALWPRAKHKEEICPAVAKRFGVSQSYVEKAVRSIDPTRRAAMKAHAAAFAGFMKDLLRLTDLNMTTDALGDAFVKLLYSKGLVRSDGGDYLLRLIVTGRKKKIRRT